MAEHYGMSSSNEWYTPPRYLAAVHNLMGGIDVDPASCAAANERVKAATYYTIDDDGFNRDWRGRVFLNPPYGNVGGYNKDGSWNPRKGDGNQERWSRRLIAQYEAGITTEAVLLVTAATSERWFGALWEYPICFTKRIKFIPGAGQTSGGNTKGTVFVYLGPQLERFAALFSPIGHIVTAYRPPRLCAACGEPVTPLPTGRVPRYCKDACKQRAYRSRSHATP